MKPHPKSVLAAAMAADLLKRARTEWVTRAEAADELGVQLATASAWLRTWEDCGLLLSRERRPAAGQRGTWCTEYTLRPAFGGTCAGDGDGP